MDLFRGTLLVLVLSAWGCSAFLDLLISDKEHEILAGSSPSIYLIEGGVVRPYVLIHASALKPEKNSVTFQWRTSSSIHYSFHTVSGDTSVLETPNLEISKTGIFQDTHGELSEFSLALPCTGRVSGTTFFTIQMEFTKHLKENGRKLSSSVTLRKECVKGGKGEEYSPWDYVAPAAGHSLPQAHVALSHRSPNHALPIRSSKDPAGLSGRVHHHNTPQQKPDSSNLPAVPSPALLCDMCKMPESPEELRDIICRSDYVTRARLNVFSSSRPSVNRKWISLRLRNINPFISWPLVAARQKVAQPVGVSAAVRSSIQRAKLVLGRDGQHCTCGGRINNLERFMLVGKFSKSARQLVVRHNRGMLLPWKDVKILFRRARQLTCPPRY